MNYETQVAEEESKPEAVEEADDDDEDTLARNEARQGSGSGSGSSSDVTETQIHCRKGLPAREAPANDDNDDDDEQPTTSSKALSVFGELREVQPLGQLGAPVAAAAAGATRGGWTTLEHVFVACTVGLITPNDLLTLCLIVIGVIIIIAIALA